MTMNNGTIEHMVHRHGATSMGTKKHALLSVQTEPGTAENLLTARLSPK
ncbi:hypothetical protein [Dictyobacter formicarum]|nr:hypothetical protein [Dictyobacter formicarum]